MTGHAGGGGRSRGDTKAHSCPANVRVHAGLGDPEMTRDLFCGKTAGDRTQHLTLTVGQRGDRLGVPREEAPGNDVPGENTDHRGSRAPHARCKRPRLAG